MLFTSNLPARIFSTAALLPALPSGVLATNVIASALGTRLPIADSSTRGEPSGFAMVLASALALTTVPGDMGAD